jgi:peroxiredoxin
VRADIAPGGVFPDYELPDHESVPRRLSEIQGDDPLVLTLARGHFCPKEHQQHLQLAAAYPQFAVAYTKIATISTDAHHESQEFRASVGAVWPFLSDPERTVQKDLDIQEYTDPDHDPMIPHTLVLKHLQRLLVLGSAVGRGSPPGPARGHERDPSRLGPRRSRPARGLGRRRLLALPRLGQARRRDRHLVTTGNVAAPGRRLPAGRGIIR